MQDGSDHHQGSRIVRSTGRKDRHSKINTVKGTRDRRVRLSAHTAIQLYDVQDRLGYDQPSKAVDWLLQKAKSAIDALDDSARPNHPAAALPHEQGIEEEEQSPTYAQWGLQSDPEAEAEDSAFDFQRMQQLENAQNRLGSLQPLQDQNLLEGAFYSPSPLCYDATSLAGCSSDRQFQDMVHQGNWSAGFNSSALNQFCSGSGTLQSNNPMTIRAPSMQPPASIDPRQMSAMALYSSSMSSNELASDKYYGSPFMPHVHGGTEEQGTHSKQHFPGYK